MSAGAARELAMDRLRIAKPFMLLNVALGVVVCAYAAVRLPYARLDLVFLLLTVATVALTARITVRIPGVNGHITISETFIFLTMLLYGGEAAILLAVADGISSALLISRKVLTVACNSAMLAIATFVTVRVFEYFFGPITAFAEMPFSARFMAAASLMALVQYFTNSVLIATAQALKTDQPIWNVWSKYCLWTSITYFAGASAAVIAAKLAGFLGYYAIIATTPVIVIIYLTYRTYLKNIEVMAAAAKAEAAAEARAEAAAAQAEQAERHIAELNHYIAEQDRIREQYAQIEKLSALGELASGVAHDLNNTLAGILGRAQLLLMTDDPARVEQGLKLIIKTAKDGAKTVKRIQNFARQRKDHDFAPVSMDQILLDVREITRPRWKNSAEAENVHINLELQLGSDGVLVMGDESELREVLVNMVFNAVDAMPQGGTITLSTRRAGDEVELCVRDTGMGMTEDVRSRVFDPFFTTKGKAGMGLGLAVSFGIIRRHEGTVEARSEPGRGSSFHIRLPRAKEGARAKLSSDLLPPLSAVPQPTGQTRVLVVDDEENMRVLLRDILEREGFQVFTASGGQEALALLEETTFDGVFTDLGMPGMTGWELAHAIRKRDERLPLAAVTGWGEAVGSTEREAARVNWLIAKPFDTSQIAEVAREISRLRESQTEESVSTAA